MKILITIIFCLLLSTVSSCQSNQYPDWQLDHAQIKVDSVFYTSKHNEVIFRIDNRYVYRINYDTIKLANQKLISHYSDTNQHWYNDDFLMVMNHYQRVDSNNSHILNKDLFSAENQFSFNEIFSAKINIIDTVEIKYPPGCVITKDTEFIYDTLYRFSIDIFRKNKLVHRNILYGKYDLEQIEYDLNQIKVFYLKKQKMYFCIGSIYIVRRDFEEVRITLYCP